MELFTWTSLLISTLQVVVSATVSASAIADGTDISSRQSWRGAVMVNSIEVGVILLAKLWALYQWYDVFRQQNAAKEAHRANLVIDDARKDIKTEEKA